MNPNKKNENSPINLNAIRSHDYDDLDHFATMTRIKHARIESAIRANNNNSSKKKRTSSRMQKSGKKDRKRSLWY